MSQLRNDTKEATKQLNEQIKSYMLDKEIEFPDSSAYQLLVPIFVDGDDYSLDNAACLSEIIIQRIDDNTFLEGIVNKIGSRFDESVESIRETGDHDLYTYITYIGQKQLLLEIIIRIDTIETLGIVAIRTKSEK